MVIINILLVHNPFKQPDFGGTQTFNSARIDKLIAWVETKVRCCHPKMTQISKTVEVDANAVSLNLWFGISLKLFGQYSRNIIKFLP